MALHPAVFEPQPKRPRKHRPKTTAEIFREFQSEGIADAVLAEAAQLFFEHYGIPPPGRQNQVRSAERREKSRTTRVLRPESLDSLGPDQSHNLSQVGNADLES